MPKRDDRPSDAGSDRLQGEMALGPRARLEIRPMRHGDLAHFERYAHAQRRCGGERELRGRLRTKPMIDADSQEFVP